MRGGRGMPTSFGASSATASPFPRGPCPPRSPSARFCPPPPTTMNDDRRRRVWRLHRRVWRRTTRTTHPTSPTSTRRASDGRTRARVASTSRRPPLSIAAEARRAADRIPAADPSRTTPRPSPFTASDRRPWRSRAARSSRCTAYASRTFPTSAAASGRLGRRRRRGLRRRLFGASRPDEPRDPRRRRYWEHRSTPKSP